MSRNIAQFDDAAETGMFGFGYEAQFADKGAVEQTWNDCFPIGEHYGKDGRHYFCSDGNALDIINAFEAGMKATPQQGVPVLVRHGMDPRYGADAVAWITGLRREGNVVQYSGEWCDDPAPGQKSVKDKVKDKNLRYGSPAFAWTWDDQGRINPTRLLEFSLLNTPAFSVLSEQRAETQVGGSMNFKELLAKLLGISPTAKDEEFSAAVAAFAAKQTAPAAPAPAQGQSPLEQRLASLEGTIATFLTQMAQNTAVTRAQAALQARQITPAQVEAATQIFAAGAGASEAFGKFLAAAPKDRRSARPEAAVPQPAAGQTDAPEVDKTSSEFLTQVARFAAKHGITEEQAVPLVVAEFAAAAVAAEEAQTQ